MIRRRTVFILLLFLCIHTAPYAYGAGLISRFQPFVSVKGEYSDNVHLTKTDKTGDYIVTVQPGIRFSNMDKKRRAGVDLEYSLGAVYYGKQTNLRNYISHNASLNMKYLTASRINFYLRESFIQSDEPREREYFTGSGANRYVLATTTERAVYWRNVVEPTIEYQFGPENRLGINYRNNVYRTESTSHQNSQENYVNPFFSYWFDKRNGIHLEYGFTHGNFDHYPDMTGHRSTARYLYRLNPRSTLFVGYSYTKRIFDTLQPTDFPVITDYDVHEPDIGATFRIGAAVTATVQVGYFWTRPKAGSGKQGLSYRGELANTDPRTRYSVTLQGGYTEDYFTSQNLGFIRYHRLTGTLNHMLSKQISIGGFGSIEYAGYEVADRKDTIWGIGGRVSYMPLSWLTFALEASHRGSQSNIDSLGYTENRGMLSVTAMY